MAFAVWFTGLPGSGKTSIASKTASILQKNGIDVKILQLDEIRKVLTPKPKYSDEERDIVYASLGYMAKLLTENGINVFIDATANKRKYRDAARKMIPNFAEVFVKCSLSECIERESRRKATFSPKNIYKSSTKSDANVPGVNVVYEEPNAPEIVIDSETMQLEDSGKKAADGIRYIFKDKK